MLLLKDIDTVNQHNMYEQKNAQIYVFLGFFLAAGNNTLLSINL